MPRLILATTCADRKSAAVGGKLALREIPVLAAAKRAKAWAEALMKRQGGLVSAGLLYQGDHWQSSVAAALAAGEAGFATELWVISAGYGLYPATVPVSPYAATFTVGHRDSVLPHNAPPECRTDYMADWWASLAKHLRLEGVSARTFAEHARSDPDIRLLVVSGERYLDAITNDLMAAAGALSDRGNLVVISGGASGRAHHPLKDHLLPVDARFQSLVKGARSALNARVAGWLLRRLTGPQSFGMEPFRARLTSELATLPETHKYDRTPMSDPQVVTWIRKKLIEFDQPSASAMLRFFRDSGLACEQKRFGGLFRKAIEGRSLRRKP